MIHEILKSSCVLKAFESKRNTVVLVSYEGTQYVLKSFNQDTAIEQEVAVLTDLQGRLPVPSIIEREDKHLLLEYIPGITFLDLYLDQEQKGESPEYVVSILIDYLCKFYALSRQEGHSIILQDVNFRNFIYHEGHLTGIDFELCQAGEMEQDIGKIMAFALSYSPAETPFKKAFVEAFMIACQTQLHVCEECVLTYFEEEKSAIKMRRRKK